METIGQEVRLLNYMVIGEVRSGSTVVQSSLCNRSGAVCHGELLHPSEDVRREAHEAYFGLAKNPQKLPEWFKEGEISPWQYINHTILDNPKKGECAVGFRLMYPQVHKWELYDLFETRCREGDFCIVHVVRNPIACFVSLKQAEKSGKWARSWNSDGSDRCPSPVSLDASELVEFCRVHASIQGKIRAACSDLLEITYLEMFLDYQGVMRKVFEFLELPDSEEPAVATCKRLRNRPVRQRIVNWDRLRKEVPSDVQKLFDSEDLF